jgi:hypothetical protein
VASTNLKGNAPTPEFASPKNLDNEFSTSTPITAIFSEELRIEAMQRECWCMQLYRSKITGLKSLLP